MSRIKVRDDGWIMLPAVVRRRMGITAGDELTCREAGNGFVLYPALHAPKPETPSSLAPSGGEATPERPKSKRGVPIIAKARGRRRASEN